MSTQNPNQDAYPELTNSVTARLIMNNPQLAQNAEQVFTQARAVSAVLGPQGFTGDGLQMVNAPGGVTVWRESERTSQLSFDDAGKIISGAMNQSNSNQNPQPNTSQNPPASTPQSNSAASNDPLAATQSQSVPGANTANTNATPTATPNDVPATAQPQTISVGGISINPQDLNYRLGDFQVGARVPGDNSANLFANYTNPNASAFLQSAEVGANGTISPNVALNDIYAQANFRFDPNNPNFTGDAKVSYSFPTNDLSATAGVNYTSPGNDVNLKVIPSLSGPKLA